jgi:GNAT superfamily N-acetyltransferase
MRSDDRNFGIRPARAADAPYLAATRMDFMKIVKDGGLADEDGWLSFLTGHFSRALSKGRLLAWLAVAGGEARATAALRLDRVKAGRGPAGSVDGYVMSVYTEPGWRGRGMARALMEGLIDEARRRGLRRLVLNPTEDGRRLYESLGFRRFRNVMVLWLEAAGPDR